jgi:hypothetical protein
MNYKEKKELSYFPAGLDEAIIKKFGKVTKAKTEWNFITGKHTTFYKASGEKKKRIEIFVSGFIEGNLELGKRLNAISNP